MARSWAFCLAQKGNKILFLFHTMSNFQHSHFTCRSNGRILCLQVCAWEVSDETETFPAFSMVTPCMLTCSLQEQLDANENLQVSYHSSCITWYLTLSGHTLSTAILAAILNYENCSRIQKLYQAFYVSRVSWASESVEKKLYQPSQGSP